MRVPVVDVGIVRVPMDDPRVSVDVGMRLAGGIARPVHMLMMRVVRVPVLVGHGLVHVVVGVLLDQVEI